MTAPRRVLMVSSLWPPRVLGGAETYAAALGTRLRAIGIEVGAFTLGVDGPDVVGQVRAWPYALDDFAEQPRSRRALFHLRDLYNPAIRAALVETVRRFRPDVVHSHAVMGMSARALTAASPLGVAHVHSIHDYWLLCRRATLMRRDGRACTTRCLSCRITSGARDALVRAHPPEVVIAVSRAVAREHARVGWLAPRLRVVPNPVEVPAVVAERSVGGRPVTFGFLGRLDTAKGVEDLLGAWREVEGARLVIAGTGPLLAAVTSAAGVEYRGWVDEPGKERFFADIDALVVPSRWRDPAPLVVNEARARSVPVIGADIGGIPELLAPVCVPLRFPPGDMAALAARLRAFADDPVRYQPAGPGHVITWDDHVGRIVLAYQDARQATARADR